MSLRKLNRDVVTVGDLRIPLTGFELRARRCGWGGRNGAGGRGGGSSKGASLVTGASVGDASAVDASGGGSAVSASSCASADEVVFGDNEADEGSGSFFRESVDDPIECTDSREGSSAVLGIRGDAVDD